MSNAKENEGRYLKSVIDGYVYCYTDALAARGDMERYVPEAIPVVIPETPVEAEAAVVPGPHVPSALPPLPRPLDKMRKNDLLAYALAPPFNRKLSRNRKVAGLRRAVAELRTEEM